MPASDIIFGVGCMSGIYYSTSDLYSTWENKDGYCVNEKPRRIGVIFDDVERELKEQYPKLCEEMDYFCLADGWRQRDDPYDLKTRRVAVYYVTGGSEGYYVHVDAIEGPKRTMMFLGKTLLGGQAGRAWGESMVAALSRIMYV